MELPALQTDNGKFAILELDRGPQLAQQLGLDLKLTGGVETLSVVLRDIAANLAPHASAVVADPVYSFPMMLNDVERGLVLRLEQISGEIDPNTTPRLGNNWGVEEIANNYAVAKLGLSYHPAEATALEKKQLVAELASYCQHLGISFMLKLSITPQADEPAQGPAFQEAQLTAVQELRATAEAMVLEYPGDAVSAATLTAELDHPWLVALAGGPYETVKQNLRVALENGAAGFFVGDALWSEIGEMRGADQLPDIKKIQSFIETTARDRMIELSRIVTESD